MKKETKSSIAKDAFLKELKIATKEELSHKNKDIRKVEKRKEMDLRYRLIDMATTKEELDQILKKPFMTNEELLKNNNSLRKDRRKTWGDRGFRTMGPLVGAAIGGGIGSIVPGIGTAIGIAVGLLIGVVTGYAIQKVMMNYSIRQHKAVKRAVANGKKAYKQEKGRQENVKKYQTSPVDIDIHGIDSKQLIKQTDAEFSKRTIDSNKDKLPKFSKPKKRTTHKTKMRAQR